MGTDTEFWKTKHLDQLTDSEWESLCDGCGKCCLVKLLDDDTEEIHYTAIACKLLNTTTCRCRHYEKRKQLVPDCLILRPLTPELAQILPDTCAYRLLYYSEELPTWHPLITGDKNSTKKAGMSVKDKVISENDVHPLAVQDYIID